MLRHSLAPESACVSEEKSIDFASLANIYNIANVIY